MNLVNEVLIKLKGDVKMINKKTKGNGCLLVIILLGFNLLFGAWSVLEILSWFGKSIPWIIAVIIGLIGGEFTIPVAIIGIILRVFGIF
jgi:hypothetical protein